MSRKFTPQFADPKGILATGPDGNAIIAEGTAVPTNATAGYAPGCIFFKRSGAAGAAQYRNDGTAASCAFVATASGFGLAGVAAGYKLARGTVTLDGTNPTTAATGLTTIVAATCSLKQATAPGDDPSWLSLNYSGTDGNLDIYAWKNTGGTDPTLIASTNSTATVDWIAIGT